MPYFIRLISKSTVVPDYAELSAFCASWNTANQKIMLEKGTTEAWQSIYLETLDGTPILLIERDFSGGGGLFEAEISEFIECLSDQLPQSAASWVTEYIRDAKQTIAFQFLPAAFSDSHGNMPGEILREIQRMIGGLVQADGEGWSNELGWHVVWDFSDNVDGSWGCAVREDDRWTTFRMDLGNETHRAAFKAGVVPETATDVTRR